MTGVTSFFEGLNHTEIFEYCLGFDKPGAPATAECVALIALKCGVPIQNRFVMDIGLHIISRERTCDIASRRQGRSGSGPYQPPDFDSLTA